MRRRQRAIRPEQWTHEALLRAPKPARLTGMGLWGIADDEGRLELRPDLIAGSIYPGDPAMTADVIEEHLLELDDAGFLTIYTAAGRTLLELVSPLLTQRPTPSPLPPPARSPDPENSGKFLAVGGARERADERVRAEAGERAGEWADWEREQEREAAPRRPLLADAPPIGCPAHPNGRYEDCGPCGTARRRHDHWLSENRYAEQVARYEARR